MLLLSLPFSRKQRLTFRSVISDIPKSFPHFFALSGLGRSRRHCTPLISLDPAISATGCHQVGCRLTSFSHHFSIFLEQLTFSTKPALRGWPDRRPALQQQL